MKSDAPHSPVAAQRPVIDPRHLELLRELADRGSLAAVAAATHRTPSALSQQLRTAERRLGAALVEPAGRGVRLTEAGRLLADAGADVAAVLASVEARWEAYTGQASGTVTIAGLPSALSFLVPGVLRDLAALPIAVELTDLDLAEVEFGPLTADHDIVIAHSAAGPRPEGTDGLEVVPLVTEPLDVAMSRSHPLAAHDKVGPADIAGHDWIGVPAGFPFDDVARAIATAADRPLRVVQRVRDNHVVERLVASSNALALLPRFTTPGGGDVVLRPVRGVASRRHVVAILRRDRAERRAVRAVLDALRAVAREVEEAGGQARPAPCSSVGPLH